jgi:hypothetical protein
MANDFSGDATCVAVWNVDNGALTTDSKGTNTLTNNSVDSEIVDFKQGDGCANHNGLGDKLSIAEGSMDSGIPWLFGGSKTSGTVMCWFKISAFPGSGTRTLLTFGGSGLDCYRIQFTKGANWNLYLGIGKPGGADHEWFIHASTIATGIWYHVATSYSSSNDAVHIRIWDDNAGAILGSDINDTTTDPINIENGKTWTWGANTTSVGGFKDEYVVFNRVLSNAEIDSVRGGTFTGTTRAAMHYRRHLLQGVNHA